VTAVRRDVGGRPRWWRRLVVGSLVVALILVPSVVLLSSLQSLVGTPPPMLALPVAPRGDETGTTSLDGIWNAGAGSAAGYRLPLSMLGRRVILASRTDAVWGSMAVSGTSVSSGSFTVSLTQLVSGPTQRNAAGADAYPTAAFVLVRPVEFSAIPPNGAVRQFTATGDLTMHGVARSVTLTAWARRIGGTIDVLADIPVVFTEWSISIPDYGLLGRPQSPSTLEVLLRLTRARGNPPMT
jgi:YceI-like domain